MTSVRGAMAIVLSLGCAAGCGAGAELDEPVADVAVPAAATLPQAGLTPHFRAWLQRNGYGAYDFARGDLQGGSFGGRGAAADPVVNQPVIFVHGNSDRALGRGAPLSGWSASIEHFLSKGYRPQELYATTWGPASVSQAALQHHSRAHLERLRAFVEAVRAYTGAAKVDVIAHSMGVTLARKALQGGPGRDPFADEEDYDLGPSLKGAVDTFVGISGGNRGLSSCYFSGPTTPTCGAASGLYPGYMVGLLGPYGVSSILADLNDHPRAEAAHVFSIWSTVDEIVGPGDLVWGRPTGPIPGQDGERRYTTIPYGHVGSKDLSAAVQLRMVRQHRAD